MNDIFGAKGLLASHLEGFEPRPGQQEMAEAVLELLTSTQDDPFFETDQSACLAVEAETGLGKTLAYLIPAVLSGRRVVISTNTRNLQDQIIEREIPFIQQYVAPTLQAMCVKGRQNYLCLYRWHQVYSEQQATLLPDGEHQTIGQWIGETRYGDRGELSWLSSNAPLWQKICCVSHLCLGSDCPESSRCFLNKLRRDAAACQVLIVNHHLLFSDLAVRKTGYGEVLPRYEAVIFDEAHHIENVASTFFGYSFSRYQVNDLTGDIERSAATPLAPQTRKSLNAHISALTGAVEQLGLQLPKERSRLPLDDIIQHNQQVSGEIQHVLSALDQLGSLLDNTKEGSEPWDQYANRCHELSARLTLISADYFDDIPAEDLRYTHWFERTERNFSLFATPIDVAHELQSTLYASVAACVFTSATLTTGGSFSFLRKRLGLPENTRTLSFPSPFDYPGRTLLYLPQAHFPEPAAPSYPEMVQEELRQLLELSQGRALLLFTSFKAMETAYYSLKDQLPYPLFIQGEAPRHTLLKRFSQEVDSVLFAVSSFWEGVDIPGESLSLVIIDKLPFEVPSDPVIMARMNRIKASGGNPFFDFQVPRAILSLRQGAGRLMRSTSDSGVIAIMDIRLFTKGYGKRFLQSLPPSPITRDLQQVADFFTFLSTDTTPKA
ncbi:MAG: ATP-dependent helicase [Desulfobulbus propionicus]|nr:MAG: ATP-dependent helicase [Desulfobulbus propionicus]